MFLLTIKALGKGKYLLSHEMHYSIAKCVRCLRLTSWIEFYQTPIAVRIGDLGGGVPHHHQQHETDFYTNVRACYNGAFSDGGRENKCAQLAR